VLCVVLSAVFVVRGAGSVRRAVCGCVKCVVGALCVGVCFVCGAAMCVLCARGVWCVCARCVRFGLVCVV
jgi:hypothetical protein